MITLTQPARDLRWLQSAFRDGWTLRLVRVERRYRQTVWEATVTEPIRGSTHGPYRRAMAFTYFPTSPFHRP